MTQKHTPVTQSAFNELQRDMKGTCSELERVRKLNADLLEALEDTLKLANELIDKYVNTGRVKLQNPVAVKAIKAINKAKDGGI